MKLQHVLFVIADNGVSGEHLHVLLDEELPANAELWDIVELVGGKVTMPDGRQEDFVGGPYYLTGVRSPPSRYCTVQRASKPTGGRAIFLASKLQEDQS